MIKSVNLPVATIMLVMAYQQQRGLKSWSDAANELLLLALEQPAPQRPGWGGKRNRQPAK